MWKLLLLLFFIPLSSFAQFANTALFRLQSKNLYFSTSPVSTPESLCGGVVTIQTRIGTVPQNVSSPLTLTVTPSIATTFYSDPNCRKVLSSFTIPAGKNSIDFYFITRTAGSNQIIADATNFNSGAQTETVTVNQFVWTGGSGGDPSWGNGLNWKGGAAPNNTQVAYFDNTCSTNCSPMIPSSINVKGIVMDTGYTGTISQGPSAVLTIGTTGILQYGGNFVGNSADILLNNGPLVVTSGTFTSSSGTLKITDTKGGYDQHDTFIVTNANSFNHNNGMIWFFINSNYNPGMRVEVASNNPFNNMLLSGQTSMIGDDANLTSATSPTRPVVLGSVTLSNDALQGQWEFQGNLTFTANYGTYLGGENAQLFFTGTSDQTLDNTAGVQIPSGTITINKNSTAKLVLLSNITTKAGQAVNLTSGRIDLGSFTFTNNGTLTMGSGSEIYLNTGVLKVGGSSVPAGPYSSGTILAGAAP